MPAIKSIIVDDELSARESLKSLIEQTTFPIEISSIEENAANALKYLIEHKPDLIFLDIDMPVHDGFWLANKINELEIPVTIIFVTAFNEYAIQAFKYSAFDYINKPVDIDTLNNSIERFIRNRNKSEQQNKLNRLSNFIKHERLKINTIDGFHLLPAPNIIYCRASGNYTEIVLIDGKNQLALHQLGVIEDKLPADNFLRISRSIIINVEYLESVNRRTRKVVLIDTLQKYELKASGSGVRRLGNL